MNYETIIYEKKEHVAIVTLNRPDKLNAMNAQMSVDMADATADAADDKAISVLILTGAGRGFCPGADLRDLGKATAEGKNSGPQKQSKVPSAIESIRDFPKPVIAAVNGVATAGGFELLLCSDIVIAADTARIGDAHANFVGVGPWASTMAAYKMNRQKAVELLLTGDIWPAAELEKAGLLNYVVPADKLMEKAMEIADKIASHMPLAMAAAKDILKRVGLTDPATLYAYVKEVCARMGKTKDFAEGMKAFAEKRKPNYIGE
jgi:enoyl-CoA hydratase/carnithine racemase